nr:MAG TPA: hypothetical protein [Caudoviricetes sp.]
MNIINIYNTFILNLIIYLYERLQQKTIQAYCRRYESTVFYVHEYRLYLSR